MTSGALTESEREIIRRCARIAETHPDMDRECCRQTADRIASVIRAMEFVIAEERRNGQAKR